MSTSKCVVIDYGIGNVFSVLHALRACGVDATLSGDIQEIAAADRVILPGVGAFGRAADRLRTLHLDNAIKQFVDTGRPFLGVCVGMQLLMDSSSEFGEHAGLGLVSGTVDRINLIRKDGHNEKVPLIGWYPLSFSTSGPVNGVLGNTKQNDAYYFVHSYAVSPADNQNIAATVDHNGQHIVAAIQKENVLGLQFHPERSGDSGLGLINRFLEL